MAKFNEYPAKTIPKDADKFMLYSAEDSANKLIDYDKLADAVLDKLTSKQFTLDQGTKTLLSALNELNSNSLTVISIQDANNVDVGFNIIRWNSATLNTPSKEGTTEASDGIIISFLQDNVWGVQLSLSPGSINFYYRAKSVTWTEWKVLK